MTPPVPPRTPPVAERAPAWARILSWIAVALSVTSIAAGVVVVARGVGSIRDDQRTDPHSPAAGLGGMLLSSAGMVLTLASLVALAVFAIVAVLLRKRGRPLVPALVATAWLPPVVTVLAVLGLRAMGLTAEELRWPTVLAALSLPVPLAATVGAVLGRRGAPR